MPVRRSALVVLPWLLLSTAPLARGHAILLAAKPASGQVVSGPKIEVNLRFNSRIDAQRSRLTVAGSDGKPRSLPIGSQSSPDSLGAEANGLEIGAYVLRWQVLAVDGHITRGEVPFRVR